jgi:hypothetical protein
VSPLNLHQFLDGGFQAGQPLLAPPVCLHQFLDGGFQADQPLLALPLSLGQPLDRGLHAGQTFLAPPVRFHQFPDRLRQREQFPRQHHLADALQPLRALLQHPEQVLPGDLGRHGTFCGIRHHHPLRIGQGDVVCVLSSVVCGLSSVVCGLRHTR